MIFKFDTISYLKDKNRNINVEQLINPFNMKKIENYEDSEKWMRQFLCNELNAQPLFFSLSIENAESNNIVKNKEYIFNIKESSGRLSGSYKTTISCLENDDKIEVELIMADGEATIECSFNHTGTYQFDLSNDFYIGKDKFISIVDESTNVLSKQEINTLTFNVEQE